MSTTLGRKWKSSTRITRPKDLHCRASASSIERSGPKMEDTTRPWPIKALLRPRSIALVGVSAQGGAGAKILQSGQAQNFEYPIWPVNPNRSEIGGIRCYKSLKDLPEVPDCVVVSVPAGDVLGVLAEACELGIPAAFVISEGFADAATDEGWARQRKLAALACSANMAVAGANCMGGAGLRYPFCPTTTANFSHAVRWGISGPFPRRRGLDASFSTR